MKRRHDEVSSRTIRQYVREKLRGFAARQKQRERIRRGEKRPREIQERLFE